MGYFVGRSVVVIVLAFVLGVLVGWLWWRRRKVYFGESQAISELTTKHKARSDELSATLTRKEAELRACADEGRAKDEEIARLRAASGGAAPDGSEPADSGRADSGRAGGSGSATWSAGPGPAPVTAAAAPAPVAEPADTEAAPVLAPSDPTPETLERLATPVEEIRTEGDHSPAVAEVAPTAALLVPAQPDGSADGGGSLQSFADTDAEGADSEDAGDDLERVEGIGPRIGAALRGAGIHTFAQLADAEITTLQAALEQAGLRFAPSLPTWSRQARFLADGDEAGFLALTQQLVGGRDVSGDK